MCGKKWIINEKEKDNMKKQNYFHIYKNIFTIFTHVI